MICECGGVLQPAQLEAFDMSDLVGRLVPPFRTPGYRCDKCQGETVHGDIINAYMAGFEREGRPQQPAYEKLHEAIVALRACLEENMPTDGKLFQFSYDPMMTPGQSIMIFTSRASEERYCRARSALQTSATLLGIRFVPPESLLPVENSRKSSPLRESPDRAGATVAPERPTYEALLAGLKELTAYHNDFLDYVMNGKPIKNRNAPKRIGALIARAGG